MTKKSTKDQVRKVSVPLAAKLYDKDESVIRRRCQNQKLVARQQCDGGDWEIFMPEDEYQERKLILELRRKSTQKT